MVTRKRSRELEDPARLLASRLRYHYRCLREDATDPDMTSVERLALVRDRAKRIREIQRELERTTSADSIGQQSVGASRKPVVPGGVDGAK